MGKKKRIEVRESEIPDIEVKVFTNDFKPIGTYSLNNFMEKYGGYKYL